MLACRGIWDWLLQRVSAVITGIYAVWVLSYFLIYAPVTYETWSTLFSHSGLKWATFFVAISVLVHAWIGLWTVFTDYVKPLAWRWFLQTLVIGLLLTYGAWIILILWY